MSRVGLVLAGGGARGAYEVGVLATLLPALERRGERPSMFVGTSVGAINAIYLAASRHLDAEEAAEGGGERWREVTKGSVVRPLLPYQVPITALRYAGELLSIPGVRMPSLLDPKPLEANLRRWIDFPALHRNVRDGTVQAAAAVTTAARTGSTVVFVEGGDPPAHRSHVMDYVPAELGERHVRASAAIPLLFPPVRIEDPPAARGWYFDGGSRLNTPIKPALDLGAEKLVVVATDAVTPAGVEEGRHDSGPPDFGDGALHLLQGTLVDPLVEDMRMLGNVNLFFVEGQGAPAREGARRYRAARGKSPYREVPYIFVAPRRRGAIGEVATEVFRARYGGLRGLRSPDFPLLSRLLGGESPNHGELLSYLFFDRDFIDELIRMGEEDARRWLREPPGPGEPWQLEPLDAFTQERGAARTAPYPSAQ